MKKFTIPTQFGSKKSPFSVYIGDGISPKRHPLYYQQLWLSEERGGEMPAEVIESFAKLAKIAIEQNVSFEELCVYALGAANEQQKKNSDSAEIIALNTQIQADKNNPELYIKRAELYRKQRRFNEMRADYQTVLKINPDYVPAYVSRGRYYLATRDFKAAAADFGAAISRQPDEVELYRLRADAYHGLRTRTTAMFKDLDTVIAREPNAEHYLLRGQRYAQNRRHTSAIADYTAAIELEPDRAELYAERSQSHELLKDLPAAIDDLSHAIRLNANEASYYERRARLQARQDQFDAAYADYTEAIKLKPNVAGHLAGRARILQARGDLARARQDWDEAVRLQPTPQYLEERAGILEQSGEEAAASADYLRAAQLYRRRDARTVNLHNVIRMANAALRCQPGNVEVLVERADAMLALRTSDTGKILEDCEQAIRLQPNNRDAWRIKGQLLHGRLAQNDEAIAAFTQAIECDAAWAEGYVLRASAYAATGDYEAAITDLNNALQIAPGQYGALIQLSDIYLKTDRLQQALESSEKAIQTNKRAPALEALMYKAEACERLEAWDQALATLATAIKLHSRFWRPLVVRARLHRKRNDLEAAITDYHSALRLNRRSIDILTELAETYMQMGDMKLARAQAQKIVTIDRQNAFAQKILSE